MKGWLMLLVIQNMIVPRIVSADDSVQDATIAMALNKETNAYYVGVKFKGAAIEDFLVDTGSSYMVINHNILNALKKTGHASFVRDLAAYTVDNRRIIVPVYLIKEINIGKKCTLFDVEAAVFSDEARPILGLSALQKAAPFLFSTTPPTLQFTNCGNRGVLTADAN